MLWLLIVGFWPILMKELNQMLFKKLSVLLFVFTLSISSTFAASKLWGLGAVVGEPTGFSVNYFLGETRTINTVLAFDFDGRNEVEIFSHLVWRKKSTDINHLPFGWFYGIGGKISFLENYDHNHRHSRDDDYDDHDSDDDFLLGPSGTLGLFYEFETAPLEVFLKSNLTMNIIEDTDVELDLMVGLHYNF